MSLYGRAGEGRGRGRRGAYPASALHGAGLWELDADGEPVPRAHGSVTERWFREHQPRGGLAGPVHELIRGSEEARVAAVGALVSTFFTGTGADHVGAHRGRAAQRRLPGDRRPRATRQPAGAGLPGAVRDR